MLRGKKLLILFLFALLGCVDNDNRRYTAVCVEGETKEIYAGTGILSYTNILSGLEGSEFHFVITDHNIQEVMLPLVVCNPNDFAILNPSIGDMEVSFQGIVEILPETIDAGSTIFQIETINAL